jgi:hypothetical protein
MPKTARRTWQLAESRIARMFGCQRAILSGSSGRDDTTCSDSTHPTLFLEVMLRQRHAVRALHDATRDLARRGGKTPVLALLDKGRPGALIVCHTDDLVPLAVAVVAALDDHGLADFTAAVQRARAQRLGLEPGDVATPFPGSA